MRRPGPGLGLGRARGETGSITPFVLIAVLALIPLAGLVIDGGRQLNGRARAIAYAQEGARAGAQALDLDVQETRLVPDLARQIVERYCDEAMNGDGAGRIRGDATLTSCRPLLVRDQDNAGAFLTIGVETTVEVDPLILDMFGAGPLSARGRAVARAFSGITEADEGAVPTVPPPTVATADPGEGGLPTVGPGEQDPLEPGELPPCVTPPPTTPTPDDPPGDDDPPRDDDPTPSPSTSPTTPTPPPSPPPNNDLDGDNAPDCPTTAPSEPPPDDPQGDPQDEDAGGEEAP